MRETKKKKIFVKKKGYKIDPYRKSKSEKHQSKIRHGSWLFHTKIGARWALTVGVSAFHTRMNQIKKEYSKTTFKSIMLWTDCGQLNEFYYLNTTEKSSVTTVGKVSETCSNKLSLSCANVATVGCARIIPWFARAPVTCSRNKKEKKSILSLKPKIVHPDLVNMNQSLAKVLFVNIIRGSSRRKRKSGKP